MTQKLSLKDEQDKCRNLSAHLESCIALYTMWQKCHYDIRNLLIWNPVLQFDLKDSALVLNKAGIFVCKIKLVQRHTDSLL